MTTITDESPRSAREASKAQSRARLIDATAEAIHRHGIRGATIGEIQAISGLSRGMINLHFDGKENLLLATARSLTQAYDAHVETAIAAAGSDPAAQLRALFQADLDAKVLNARAVAIWFSFRAEMHANPAFKADISTRSGGFSTRLGAICAAMGLSPDEARLASFALIALLEGLWTDFHLDPEGFDRQEAFETCLYTAGRFFPGHFSEAAGAGESPPTA